MFVYRQSESAFAITLCLVIIFSILTVSSREARLELANLADAASARRNPRMLDHAKHSDALAYSRKHIALAGMLLA